MTSKNIAVGGKRELRGDKRGVTMLEYGLIGALVAAVCIGTLASMGGNIKGTFESVSNSVQSANTSGSSTGK